jgi:hypothetical protein
VSLTVAILGMIVALPRFGCCICGYIRDFVLLDTAGAGSEAVDPDLTEQADRGRTAA